MKRKFFSTLMTVVLTLTLVVFAAPAPVSAVAIDLAVNDENPWTDGAFTFEDILPGGDPMEFDFKLHNVGDNPGILTFSMSVSENDMAGAPLPNMSADEFASLVYVEAVSYQYIWLDHPDKETHPNGYIGSVKDDLPSWLTIDGYFNNDGKVSLYELCLASPIPYGDYAGDQLEAGAEITYFIEFQLGSSLDPFEAGGAIQTGVEDYAPMGDGISVTITATLETVTEQSSGNVFQAGVPMGIVALWHFDEGSGWPTTSDSSGNGNTGILSHGASWTTSGKFGNALSFDGRDDYVLVAGDDTLDITTAITIEAWINPTTLGGWKYIVSKRRWDVANYGFRLNGQKVEFYYMGSTGWQVWQSTSNVVSTGSWQHVAVAFTFGSGSVACYVNGTPVGGSWIIGDGTDSATANIFPLRIGALYPALKLPFHGLIDEVRIWDQVLTDEQVEASYDLSNGTQIKEKDLDKDGYPDVIFTSAFYELDDDDTITLTMLPVNPSVSITGVTINRVTPNRRYGAITAGSVSASGYSVPVTVYNVHATKPPCKTIHLWLWPSASDHVGVNAQFRR